MLFRSAFLAAETAEEAMRALSDNGLAPTAIGRLAPRASEAVVTSGRLKL